MLAMVTLLTYIVNGALERSVKPPAQETVPPFSLASPPSHSPSWYLEGVCGYWCALSLQSAAFNVRTTWPSMSHWSLVGFQSTE